MFRKKLQQGSLTEREFKSTKNSRQLNREEESNNATSFLDIHLQAEATAYSKLYLSLYGSTALCWTLADFSVS
jgi:hypothetical protein